ncbi:MAG: hypothetical protein KF729_18710 [Sandaracinaceae bacterium]|nr:hypothetical protein [Sandaracinaceae bacterium]
MILCAVLGLAPLGCDGGGGTDAGPSGSDAGAGTDAGPTGMDAGPGVDAGPSEDAGGGMDAGETDAGETDAGETDAGETDAGETDAGTDAGETDAGTDAGMPSGIARFRDASRALTAHYCMCDFTGYADAAECAAFGRNPAVDACQDTVYAAVTGAMASIECRAMAREAYVTCAASVACDEDLLEICDDDEFDAVSLCPTLPSEFGTMLGTCVETNVIGTTPSTCPENATVSSATGAAVFMGDTTGGGSDVVLSCASSFFCDDTAADRAFAWAAPADGTYVFDTNGSGFDTVLALSDTCGGTELACNDDASGTPDIGFRSRLSLAMTSGQMVIVHVKGCSNFDAGAFRVNINLAP